MNAGATMVSIVYDAFGNRVAKTVNGITTKYLVDDLNPTGYAQVLDELSGGAVMRTYTYGLQRISQRQIVNSTWTPSFYSFDGGANVRQLTNSAGAVTDTYDYDAFGNDINHAGSTPNNYLYRGEQYDPDLGLYYLRARYYNPQTGRFMSRDPEDGKANEPASLHKYLYASGDPTNRLDPGGRGDTMEFPLIVGKISASAVVIAGLKVASAAVACALIWEGTKTYAETVAGPFGKVVMVAPCVWLGIPDPWTLRKWLDDYLDNTPSPPLPPNPSCGPQYENDLNTCRQVKKASCYAAAMARYAACLAGTQIPPFNF
jgi:RHS repeat-associated protein